MRNRHLSALSLFTGCLVLSGPAGAQIDLSGRPCRDPSLRPSEYIDEHLIYFAHGSAELPRREWVDIVLRSAACHAQIEPSSVRVIAHTDTSGSPEHNVDLSIRRGKAVVEALVRLGVRPETIAMEGRGETNPAVATGDGVQEPLNRRVTIEWRPSPAAR